MYLTYPGTCCYSPIIGALMNGYQSAPSALGLWLAWRSPQLPLAHAAVNQQEPDKIQSSRDEALMTLVKSAGMAKR